MSSTKLFVSVRFMYEGGRLGGGEIRVWRSEVRDWKSEVPAFFDDKERKEHKIDLRLLTHDF